VSERPIKLCIAALGGQGGGVLTEWLIEIAESQGYLVQSTSVPGVAQRTGATIYYLEFFPRAAAERVGKEPVMALMPVPGDVDCLVASELVEAGRAIQRGLVSPQRTTLIASSHRSYTISEKSAPGHGMADEAALAALARSQAQRLVLFDMEAVAEVHQSVISSVLLGAICGAGVLPFPTEAFEAAIEHSGIAVTTNLAAFEDARSRASSPSMDVPPADTPEPEIPARARSESLQPLLDRIRCLPQGVRSVALAGARRMIDYQDPAYAELYLTRLERIAALDESPSAGDAWALTEAVARGLALWMSFEDTIRVADLKTRATRFARVREEVRAEPNQIVGISEFLRPRAAEIAGTLPASLGRWLLDSPRRVRWLERFTGGKRIRTSSVSGFLFLYLLAGLRRWRRGTLRYREENLRIEAWLARIEQLTPTHSNLALELARAQRFIKGYGETHERGWKTFSTLIAQLDLLAARPDGAQLMARLQAAALMDETGSALARALSALHNTAAAGDLSERPAAAAPS
jgi:indolepyruvate ferredoxin oxidoreductase beta subunit